MRNFKRATWGKRKERDEMKLFDVFKRKSISKKEAREAEVREAVNSVMPDLDALISKAMEKNVFKASPNTNAITNNETSKQAKHKEAENMYNLDDNFLTEIGIINMPEPARGHLVEGIQQSISDRVGLAIVDLIDDNQADEIDKINNSPQFAKKWLETKIPHYAGSQEFNHFLQHVAAEEAASTQLYAQTKWFERNLPNLPAVVEKVKNDVMQELKALNGK